MAERTFFVDFDHGLNIAINKLRDTLGDSAAKPRFIETLPRRGYRWIASVECVEAGRENAQDDVPASAPPEAGSFAQNLIGKRVSHTAYSRCWAAGKWRSSTRGKTLSWAAAWP